VAASAAEFFLQQILVESPEEEAALEWEYLQAAESPLAGQAPLPPLVAAAAVNPLEPLRGAEKPQPLPGGFLKHQQPRSRNTIVGVAGR
jgi:hypothetical protein